eukprot:scaffold1803_cov92-Amphora_coffeaeformis.AAC.18
MGQGWLVICVEANRRPRLIQNLHAICASSRTDSFLFHCERERQPGETCNLCHKFSQDVYYYDVLNFCLFMCRPCDANAPPLTAFWTEPSI